MSFDGKIIDDDDDCVICMVPLSEGISIRRSCINGHYFHLSCITLWQNKNNTCPICRDLLRPHIKTNDETRNSPRNRNIAARSRNRSTTRSRNNVRSPAISSTRSRNRLRSSRNRSRSPVRSRNNALSPVPATVSRNNIRSPIRSRSPAIRRLRSMISQFFQRR